MTLVSGSGRLEIEIDLDRCMGSGNCGFYAPDTFDVGDDNKAFMLDGTRDPDNKIRLAAEGCPTNAIRLSDG